MAQYLFNFSNDSAGSLISCSGRMTPIVQNIVEMSTTTPAEHRKDDPDRRSRGCFRQHGPSLMWNYIVEGLSTVEL